MEHFMTPPYHSSTWDPHLCHWSISNWLLGSCVHMSHDGILTWMIHIDTHAYFCDGTLLYFPMFHDDLVVFHDDISLYHDVFMMNGRMYSRTWDPGISPHDVLLCITLFDDVYWGIFCIPQFVYFLVLALLINRV